MKTRTIMVTFELETNLNLVEVRQELQHTLWLGRIKQVQFNVIDKTKPKPSRSGKRAKRK